MEPLQLRPLTRWTCWQMTAGLNVPAAGVLMPRGRIDTYRRIRLLAARGPAFATFSGPHLLCVGGLAEMIPHVGEGWTIVHPRVTTLGFGFRLVRFTRRALADLVARSHFHRVTACCPAEAAAINGWLTGIGFTYETVMRRACSDGGAMHVYRIFREDLNHGT